MEIVHEGYLKKSPPPKRLWRAKWRRRWFVLRSGELPGQYFLEYYTDNSRRKLKGKIDLDQCEQVDAGITFANRKFEYKYMFDIKTPKRVYYLCAETEAEMNKWVDCVCQVCGLKVFQPDEEYYDPMGPPPLDSGTHQRQAQMDHMGNPMHHGPTDTPPTPSHRMDHSSLGMDSPPISPVSPASTISGPYIPLKDCITGKKATNFPFNDHDMPLQSFYNDRNRSSIPNEMAPSAPITHGQEVPATPGVAGATAVTTGAKPRDTRESYDIPRTLSRKSGASNDDTMSIQSPVETEGSSSVFSDCEDVFGPAGVSPGGPHHTQWPDNGHSTWDRNGRASNPTMLSRTRSISEDDHMLKCGAPPRPPKPPHLAPEVPQPEYQNLNNMDTIVQKTLVRTNSAKSQKNGLVGVVLSYKPNDESVAGPVTGGAMGMSDSEPSPMSVSSSLPPSTPREITDDMYDFPRSHHPDTVSPAGSERTKSRISYNNFAPTQTVFSYDPEKTGISDFDPRISPGGQYSNIPVSSGGGRVWVPPCVDRGLKPKKPGTLSDNLSSLELSPPPSGGLMEDAAAVGHTASTGYIAPVVDRNLKPLKKIELEPAPASRPRSSKPRTLPSPNQAVYNNGVGNDSGSEADSCSNPSSRRNSTNTTEQTHFPLGASRKGVGEEKTEIQYLDLDIADFPHQSPKTPKLPIPKVLPGPTQANNNEASVVYKLVDFVKTDAFIKTRRDVDNTYRNNQ